EQTIRNDRTADVRIRPVALLVERQELASALFGYEVRSAHLIAGLAAVLVRPRLADGVDLEAAGSVEVDRLGAAADDGDLGDVVIVRIGVQHAEQRHGDVHAVEHVDVVLAAGAGARAADGIGADHDAGDELLQITVVLRDGQLADLFGGQTALQRGRLFVDQRLL